MVERDDTELSHSAAYKVEGGSRGGQAGSIWAVVVVVRVTEVREGKKSGMKEWRRKSRLGEASGGEEYQMACALTGYSPKDSVRI